jgi:hypothetical protein
MKKLILLCAVGALFAAGAIAEPLSASSPFHNAKFKLRNNKKNHRGSKPGSGRRPKVKRPKHS